MQSPSVPSLTYLFPRAQLGPGGTARTNCPIAESEFLLARLQTIKVGGRRLVTREALDALLGASNECVG